MVSRDLEQRHGDLLYSAELRQEEQPILLHYMRTVNPHVSHDKLIEQLKPVVGSEIEATMLTEGQRLEKRGYDAGHKQGHEQGHKQGYDEGQTQGHKQGHQQGYDEGQRSILLGLLGRRFGPLPASVVARVSNASTDELMRWSERVLDAERLDDIFAGL